MRGGVSFIIRMKAAVVFRKYHFGFPFLFMNIMNLNVFFCNIALNCCRCINNIRNWAIRQEKASDSIRPAEKVEFSGADFLPQNDCKSLAQFGNYGDCRSKPEHF